MIGAAFLLLSIPFIENRKFIPFLALVLIATGFHTTCIVFLAVYFLVYMDLKPKWRQLLRSQFLCLVNFLPILQTVS